MLALAVLVALAFSVWRVVNELGRLNRSLTTLQSRIAPTLEQITKEGKAAAARAGRLQARAARASDGAGAGAGSASED